MNDVLGNWSSWTPAATTIPDTPNGAMGSQGFGSFGNVLSNIGTGLMDVARAVLPAWITSRAGVQNMGTPVYSGVADAMLPAILRGGGSALGGALAGGAVSYLGAGGGGGVIRSATPGIFAGGPLDIFRPDMFVATGRGYAPRRLLPVQSPSGSLVYWRYVGRPVAFSGDLHLRKNLTKVGRRLGGPCTHARRKRRR